MKRLALVGVVLFLVMLPLGSRAQGEIEQIDIFDSRIHISKTNIASITETITYNFAELQRHGIKRYLPLKTRATGSDQFYFYDFKFLQATQDGQPAEVDLSREGDWQVIRLGSPNATVSGEHVYELNYQLSPVVERDEDGDFLNWNLTGNYWQVPIVEVRVSVSFEPGVRILESRCYSGPTGSTAQDCRVDRTANTITFTNQTRLGSGEGLTANLLLSPNSFVTYLVPQDPPPPDWRPLVGFAAGVLALLYGMGKRLWAWARHRYLLKQQTVVPQYESPDGLRPAEIGLLNDNRADMTEITATLIDLAVRGVIKK